MSKKIFFAMIGILIIVLIITALLLKEGKEQNKKSKEMPTISNSEQKLDSNEKLDTDENEDFTFEVGSYFYELQVDEEIIYFVGYTFKEDGTVIGMIGGESGVLEGKYSILNNKTIKCTFTTYSNDSVAILNQKLDTEGEVILNRLDTYILECKEWTVKPILNGEDFSFGENQTFNQFNDE